MGRPLEDGAQPHPGYPFERSVEIKGLAGYLLSREQDREPALVMFELTSAARHYSVQIWDHATEQLEHGLAPRPGQARYRVHVAAPYPPGRRTAFLPLRKKHHPTLDTAIVATIYAVLRRGDWSADEWQQELATAEQQFRELEAATPGHWSPETRDLWSYLGSIRRWIDYLDG
jgi:hypothetical protein